MMHLSNSKRVGVLCLLIGLLLGINGLAVDVLVEDFSSYTDGQALNGLNGWTNSSANVVAYSNGTDQTGYVPELEAATNFTSAGAGANVWIDMKADVLMWDGSTITRTVDPSAVVQYFFWTNKNPVVRNGTSWQQVTAPVGLFAPDNGQQIDDEAMEQLTVKVNYATGKWALFLNGVLIKQNAAFANANPGSYQWLAVREDCELDDVLVTTDWPTTLGNYDGDSMPDAYEIHVFDTINNTDSGDKDGDGFTNYREYLEGTDPTDPDDYPTGYSLPYMEDFETLTAGTFSTFHGLVPSGTVNVSESSVIQGSKKICVTEGDVKLEIEEDRATNVWFSVYTLPTPMDAKPNGLTASEAAGFCVIKTGEVAELLVYDTDGWVPTDLITEVPENTWLQFVTHVDFVAGTWNLYVSTSGVYGTATAVANSAPLGINGDYAESTLQGVTIANNAGTPTCLDEIAIALSGSAVEVGGGDETNSTVLNLAVGWNEISVPAYPEGENDMAGQLGADLLRGLSVGDKVQIFTDAGGFTTLTKTSETAWSTDNEAPADVVIDALEGIWVYRAAGEPSYPLVLAAAEPNDYTETMHDKNTQAGWNSRAEPGKFGVELSTANNFQNADVAPNDVVWEYRDGRYVKISRGTSTWYVDGAPGVSHTLVNPHWYKAAGTYTGPGGTRTETFPRVK